MFSCFLWKEDFFHSIKTKTKKTKTKFHPGRKAKGLLAQLFQSQLFHTPNSARAPHGKHGKKAVFPSRGVSLTEQASTRSRNQSAEEHQGLCCITLGVCVQDAYL